MSIHDDNYYMELDRKYNGSQLDYNESLHGDITAKRTKIEVTYHRDKKHWFKAFVDLTEIICIDKITNQRKFNIC